MVSWLRCDKACKIFQIIPIENSIEKICASTIQNGGQYVFDIQTGIVFPWIFMSFVLYTIRQPFPDCWPIKKCMRISALSDGRASASFFDLHVEYRNLPMIVLDRLYKTPALRYLTVLVTMTVFVSYIITELCRTTSVMKSLSTSPDLSLIIRRISDFIRSIYHTVYR